MQDSYTGLTSAEASRILAEQGPNSLPEKKKSIWAFILKNFLSPVSLMLLAAAFLSLYAGNVADFWIILTLFFSNFGIAFWHEKKADKSIKKLQEHLAIMVNTLRDGKWQQVPSHDLVVGDIISLRVGAIIPADVELVEAKNITANESVLTGESLPKDKKMGDTAYSGSYISTGAGTGKVTATGAHTFFGKTIASVDVKARRSSLEKDILSISKFISIISIIVVLILTAVLYAVHAPIVDVITLDLSLLIAGIPVALPTVMSLIISIGVLTLAKKQAVVRRLASLEDLANVDLLLSDKTGTLTQNLITIQKLIPFGKYTESDVIAYASSAMLEPESSPLDRAVADRAQQLSISPYSRVDYTPGDSERKRSTAVVNIDGKQMVVTSGAPRVVASLCDTGNIGYDFTNLIEEGAKQGYRSLAVAINKSGTDEKNMDMVGIIYLADNLQPDAADTLSFMRTKGIDVKMITGDSVEISKRVAGELGIKGEIYPRTILDQDQKKIKESFDSIGGFAEVLPKDKYSIVSIAREHHTVAMTGDGVNDLPAVKNADVGFAVSGAVDALKGGADIVLMENGISIIKDAIIEARKIFTRLYNYSLYRISESFRVIITIAVIGFIYKVYPLTPVQLIILAFLNDVPIVSLAFDRVKMTEKPAHIDARKRFTLSTLFGFTGVANSLILLFVMTNYMHLPWAMIQTMFFLKLTVSGHMLVYVAHTRQRWFTYLPSKQVIIATITTQLIATTFALTGFLTTQISLPLIILVWVWSFFWMQVSEMMKFQRVVRV